MDYQRRVFISVSGPDVEHYRDVFKNHMAGIHMWEPLSSHHANYDNNYERHKRNIEQCDLYILIIGHCYGAISNQTGKSIAEIEYDLAIQFAKSIFVFMADDEFAYPAKWREFDDQWLKQQNFRERVKAEQRYYHLSNNQGQLAILLITVISQDVAGYFKQIEGQHNSDQGMAITMNEGSTVTFSQFQNVRSQIGAQGSQPEARDNQFLQGFRTWGKSVDFAELASQLNELHQVLQKEAQTAKHYIAVGDVAGAAEAAKAGDDSKVAEHLKAAGQWALDVAIKIGVAVAVDALRQALAKT